MTQDHPTIVVDGSKAPVHPHDLSMWLFIESMTLLHNPFFKGGRVEVEHYRGTVDPEVPWNVTLVTADGRRFFLWNGPNQADYVLVDAAKF